VVEHVLERIKKLALREGAIKIDVGLFMDYDEVDGGNLWIVFKINVCLFWLSVF